MNQPSAARLTFNLIHRARRHWKTLALALTAMLFVALAEAAPIALAKAAMDVLFQNAPEGAPTGFGGWFQRSGVALSATLGLELPDPRLGALLFIVVTILLVGVLSAFATWANVYFGRTMSALVVKDLRLGLMQKVLQLPVDWFSRRKVGDILSRFSADVEITYSGINVFMTVITLHTLILITSGVAAFLLNWRLALVAVSVIPALAYPVARIGMKIRKLARKSLDTMGEATESVNQALSGLRVIKAFSAEDHELKSYDAVNERWIGRQKKLIRAKAASRSLMDILYSVSLAIVLGLGGALVVLDRWDLDSATFGAFLVALSAMYRPVRHLSRSFNDWQASMAAAARVFEMLDQPLPPGDSEGAVAIGPIRRSIRFEDVSFAYREDTEAATEVLKSLSFEIPAGKAVALVGPSGAGKSTIADLLFRFRRPDSGRIVVDGVPLREIQHESFLSQTAIVSQRPFLFNVSIRENIAYGRPGATQQEIEEAAKAAQIHDLILTLSAKYETIVGEQGSALSGGQLQRVTIARAILRNASFLLLDEATSNLDVESERAVQIALKNLMVGRTTLVIAHRLSTIIDTDLILVIEAGRIVEKGTHQELIAREGTYSRLYRASAS